jgi:predicted Zn-dependent protease
MPQKSISLIALLSLAIGLSTLLPITAKTSSAGHSLTSPSTLQRGKEAISSVVTGDLLLDAMSKEMTRSYSQLKSAGSAPLYFLGYRVYDTEDVNLTASYGAIESDGQYRRRILDVEARVGNMQTDSSHKLRGDFDIPMERFFLDSRSAVEFSLDDDEPAIRTALWLVTDDAFKRAQRNYIQVQANRSVKVIEEDQSADFSAAPPVVSIEKNLKPTIDAEGWRDRLRKLSAIYKQYPEITDSDVRLDIDLDERYITTSEGTKVRTQDRQARISTSVSTIAKDGMVLYLYDSIDVFDPKDLPDDATIEKKIRELAESIISLRNAPVAEPYVGPAILRGRASGVFFHEVLGHRVEGHRQKDEDEGRTFAKKVNQKIMPEFISVFDDPTMSNIDRTPLVGHYKFDNEGVPAERVTVVENGTLRNFLMGRSPIINFNKSNGHCRCEPGSKPVARQGNLIVQSSRKVPFDELKKMLVEEAKRQGKPYGLIFDEIAGGFALTQSFMPQSFQLLPLRVTKVWADGKPDQLLRGVNLVGTPLASLETIVCAADDIDTFSGVCGAESGWVPVSATSPSLLVRTVEVAREWKEQDKPPILPPPAFTGSAKGGAQ